MNICRTVTIAGYFLIADFAAAGPPFVTDDPEPPPPGGWEINIPLILERIPGKAEMDAPLIDLNYGLPDVQLKIEVPLKIAEDDKTGSSVAPATFCSA